MQPTATIEDMIADRYAGLSVKLRNAADHVAGHPVDVATRSLRAISADSGLSPATFSRLARALGFDTYEQLREMSRAAVGKRILTFAGRTDRLKPETRGEAAILEGHARSCAENILALAGTIDEDRLRTAATALEKARQVVLVGAFGSTGIVEYMACLANRFAPNWTLAGRAGAPLGPALAAIGPEDAMLVVTNAPHARRAIRATEVARRHGARTIVLTDSHTCPAIPHATVSFIVPSDSRQFFSSCAATLVLLEAIIAMLVARSREDATRRIREIEERNRDLGEFWTE